MSWILPLLGVLTKCGGSSPDFSALIYNPSVLIHRLFGIVELVELSRGLDKI